MKTLQPDSEIQLWERITKFSKVTAELIFRDDGRRLVSRRDLRRIWDCSDDTIKRYVARGMPSISIDELTALGVEREKRIDPKFVWSTPKMVIYDLAEVTAWRDANVDKTIGSGASRARKALENPLPPEDAESDEVDPQEHLGIKSYALREIIAKTLQAEEAATLAKLKRQAMEGSLVDADDLDKAMAEQAVLHKTDKINDEKVLPTLLEMKSANDIANILHAHNQERLEHFDKIINKGFKCPETLSDIIAAALIKLAKGVSPDEIIKAINA